MEAEFEDNDRNNKWNHIFQKIRSESSKTSHRFSNRESRKSENKALNRYKDVTPYDHSRIELNRCDNDYINASLVEVPSADRQYILTQGPLAHTTAHFWLMVWEQRTKAILMLNKLVERGQIKCHQYWPNGKHNDDCDELSFTDVQLKVEYLSETKYQHFILRKLLLIDTESENSREILHYHYTSWPDFGLPESPASFLEYLFAVRESGSFDVNTVGAPVIHCSAGIGRSGTLCLVDSCLIMIEKFGSTDAVNVIDVLLDMRRYRMGLIQTAEQLRFSYLAIIEGSKSILISSNNANDSNVPLNNSKRYSPKIQRLNAVNEEEQDLAKNIDDFSDNEISLCSTLPPLPPKSRRSQSTTSVSSTTPEPETNSSSTVPLHDMISNEEKANIELMNNSNSNNSQHSQATKEQELRNRVREERRKRTEETIQRIKRKQKEAEDRSRLKKLLIKYGSLSLCFVGFMGAGVLIYNSFFKGDLSIDTEFNVTPNTDL